MHLARDKGISAGLHSLIEQEVPCPTTDGNSLHRTAQQLVAHRTFHTEGFLHGQHEIIGCHRLRQSANDTTTRLYPSHLFRSQELHLLHTEFLCHLVVHPALCIIHIGMHGDDTDAVLDGLYHRTLHIRQIADGLQSSEQQGMMADNEVAAFLNGFVNHLFVDVQTQ